MIPTPAPGYSYQTGSSAYFSENFNSTIGHIEELNGILFKKNFSFQCDLISS